MNAITKKRIRLLIAAVLTGVVCYFVIRALSSQWGTVRTYDWQLKPGWLLLSAVIGWVDMVLLFHLWRIILHSVSGKSLRFPAAYRISVLANLGKYIPGKLWTVAGMVYLVGEEGIPPRSALVASALHQAFTLIPGAVYITAVLGIRIWGNLAPVTVVVGLVAAVLILYPPIFRRLLNFGLKLFRREPIEFELSFAKAFALFWVYTGAWILYGASFWCMTLGLGLPPGPFWMVNAAYGAAYLVGFLALFAPGGLGVREGILTIVLAPYLPAGLSAAVAVVSRFWMTLVELACLIPVLMGNGRPTASSKKPGNGKPA